MKLYKPFLFLICAFITLYITLGCERDDICDDDSNTTPLLIIKFIDSNDGVTIKKPIGLTVKAIDPSISEPFIVNKSQDSILIPLDINSTITKFEFTINSEDKDVTKRNMDVISFQYTKKEEYVSSACGFKINYNGLGYTLTDVTDTNKWIKNIIIKELNVTNDETAHVHIFL